MAKDYDDFGQPPVDWLGRDELGMPMGASAVVGVIAGAGTQTGVAIGVRQFTDHDRFAELAGLLAGVGVGGLMWLFPGTRSAGVVAAVSALLSGGIRQLEQMLSAKEAVKQQAAQEPVVTPPAVEPPATFRGHFGYPVIEPQMTVGPANLQSLRGLGLTVIEPSATVGPASLQSLNGPPQLVGDNMTTPASRAAQLVGAPPFSQLANHFGASLWGPR